MNITPAEVQAGIQVATTLLSMAAPLVGQPEFVPAIEALGAFAVAIDKVVAEHNAKTALQLEVAAADAAADAAENAKFPVK